MDEIVDLFKAIKKGDVKLVTDLLNKNRIELNTKYEVSFNQNRRKSFLKNRINVINNVYFKLYLKFIVQCLIIKSCF
jgi:hypothetical protein